MRRHWLGAIVLLGLGLRIAYAVAIYEPSLLAYHYGDFTEYQLAARDILDGDLVFTNPIYLIRPPLFPLLIAALGLQPAIILAVNILFAVCIIPLSYVLARQFRFSRDISLTVAAIVAIDPTSIKYSGVLLAEPLANLLLACAFVSMMVVRRADTHKSLVAWSLLSGGFIILSAFARPAAHLLWIPMAIWIFYSRSCGGGGAMLALFSFALPASLGVLVWKQHNADVLRNGSFTTIGTYNLLYYRAVQVLYHATGKTLDGVYVELATRVEARLDAETIGVLGDPAQMDADRRYRHRAPWANVEAAMSAVALEVFLEHPLYYFYTLPVGFYRAMIEVELYRGSALAGLLLRLINIPFWIAASYGIYSLVRQRRFVDALYLFLPCAYFIVGTLVVQTSGIDTRARVMVTPLLAVMAAYGIMRLLIRRRAASARRSRRA